MPRRIVDVGAGYSPWTRATELVDIRRWDRNETRPLHLIDIECDRLPFEDKSVDFIYSRHTLEDIHNPLQLCREMNRVAKAGYIEVPSPASEFSRGVDLNKMAYRGYIHHCYFIWEEDGTLLFLPKYPIVEYIQVDQANENKLADCLDRHPITWNTYFAWTGSFKFHMLRQDIDFDLRTNYIDVIMRAVNRSIQNALHFAEEYGLCQATLVPNK